MADKTINQLTAAPGSAAQAGDELEIERSGASYKVTAGWLVSLARAGLTLAWSAITGTPTTLAGYGITDAASDAELDAHAATLASGSAAGHMAAADKSKLDGVAVGATANATDAQLRDRSTHTGTQAIATVSGLQAALDAKLAVPALQTLTDASSIAWNVASGVAATVTLGGNRTLANPTNIAAGASYVLIVRQDATGSRTLSYGRAYNWPGGTAPTLSTVANAIDVLTFISDGTALYGVAAKAFS